MKHIKIIVERHKDGFVAYPLGIKGGIAGQGETYEAALADAKSAIRFHVDTFGASVFEDEASVLEAYVDDFAFAA